MSFTPKHGDTVLTPIQGGSSFASQHDLEALFGLGSANKGTVDIQWPGGVRNRLYNVHARERLVLPEIPCSYDGSWADFQSYRTCVKDALDSLVQQGVLSNHLRGRMLSSAIRTFHEQ